MGESKQVKYLIVGGGAASAQGAVGIREVDKEGSVLLVTEEPWWPYDHPPLSKGMLLGKVEPADAESKDPSWYEANNVEVRQKTEVVALDRADRVASMADGSTVQYEKLLLATGATPRKLNVKGAALENVHLFRRVHDSLSVRDAFKKASHVIFIGAGYIGLEVASGAMESGLRVTIIDPADRPWSKNTSPMTGNFLRSYYESKGAKFLLNEEVAEILGENVAEGVKTKSGVTVEGDLVVIGVGVHLNTELARSSGLEVDEKHGIVVNEQLRTDDPNVFAAGDVAAFQDVALGKRWHAEHHLNANWQGKVAGRNMAGRSETYDRVPYFFSDMLDIHMIQRGDAQGGKSAAVFGSMENADFIELYAREDGTLAMGLAFSKDESKLDPTSDKLEELFRAKSKVADLSEETFESGT